jgi:hypothetical protein
MNYVAFALAALSLGMLGFYVVKFMIEVLIGKYRS